MSTTEQIPQGADVNIISNKNEKKARELIKKLNLKQIKGISRVTFKQRGNLIYAIDSPDVYRSAAGTYVVFGEAKVDDMNQRIAEAQAQQAQQEVLSNAAGGSNASAPASEDKSPEAITADMEKASLGDNKVEEVEDDEEVDESEFDPKDIALIVEQTHVSRAKAVKALKNHNGDMVNALMELS
ncbi:EGD2 [Candida metapsilosis]|uniref:Nascent polypeptide-associated complex subunit alpha n=1 Tax=Candida metapsilosis TaxID=273372 RepID=A0A8H8DCD4_9ASCO|nr:EGD2 [Candida metapsilosis]